MTGDGGSAEAEPTTEAGEAVALAMRELETRADVFTYDALAWARFVNGETEAAELLMRRALAEGTVDARLLLHAGLIARARGDRARASRWLARASRLENALLPSERALLHEAETNGASSPQHDSTTSKTSYNDPSRKEMLLRAQPAPQQRRSS